ncbi:uncharacterized protein EHS24_008141 [Apiotrichum porosum]|uniref:Uncharacterized protein n=1 Tax=Apiotrichum porosum TaxID=105984 RepID=A0A427XSX9_9TREE|nr:uncharacterized protein EHS24_008141 [Apiotrichum porosum]RSH81944.1 hypothetical protein EHS24_008141 [Apiotrichum porosum]
MLIPALVAALLLGRGSEAAVAYNFTNLNLTYYYDSSLGGHPACAALNGGLLWSVPIIENPAACGDSIMSMHTDNVVALNVSWLNQDNMAQRPNLCGREIQIWKDGRQLPLGKLFLWEGCAACQTMPRADVSVSTL